MDDDQQFCLRWNNHQSTLVAVFDTLLENGTLVDCTLAAEGKCLNAHKVVLSACSPYFEALLSRHFDKHPILILKDVKFQELKAMMDYMYRGEVNISQDQLGALLKAAESLQIKGLSDNRKGEPERKTAPVPPPPKSPQQTSALPKVQGLTIEQRSRDDSREGSLSPGPRKKKRLRRKSEELDNHDASNSSESHSLPAQNIPSSLPAASKINADVPEPVETKSDILRHKQPDDIPQVPIIKEKIETHTELMLEPKSEYVEEMNEDSIEDLTLDDDDLSNMEQLEDQAGPSHGNAGEGSSQGFGGWHMGNQSQDEVFLAAQEAVGAHRDSQDEHRYQCDPLLSVTRIESEAGATICTYPVISSIDSLAAEEEKSENTVPERPRRTKRKPMTKTFHRELVTKLRHKYVRQKHQNILICEKKGKLIATLRCVLCNLFVRKGEQFCYRCKEYLETGKKPPVQRKTKDQLDQVPVKNKCRICSVFIRNIRGLCYKCENVQKKIKKEANLSSKGKSLSSKGTSKTKPVDKKPPTLSIMKKSRIIKKKVVKKRKKNFRCESCNSFFVHNKGDLCQKCKKRFGSENTLEKINVDSLFDIKKTEDATTEENDMMKTVQSLNSIENVEIVEEDGEGAAGGSTVFSIPLVNVNDDNIDADKSDYYVSIDDINDMLEEDS